MTITILVLVLGQGAAAAAATAPASAPATAASPATAPAAAATLADLAFMAGCWRGSSGDGTVEERYTPPQAGMMLGTTQYVAGGKTVFFELSRIEAGADGAITLWPQPAGKPSVGFTLASAARGEAVFANPEHDFPKRIIYRKTPVGLLARVEGDASSKEKASETVMKAIPCAP